MSVNIRFSWDDRKEAENVRKHGVTFGLAIKVFADPFHITQQDRIERNEYRWQSIGMIDGVKLLLVAHTWFDDAGIEFVRIISARPATAHERKQYENGDS